MFYLSTSKISDIDILERVRMLPPYIWEMEDFFCVYFSWKSLVSIARLSFSRGIFQKFLKK